MAENANVRRVYTPTKPQQELIARLGLEITPSMSGRAVNAAIDRALRAYIGKAQKANPALVVGSFIVLDGLNCKIAQIRDHRVQLTGQKQGWVAFFDIENATAAPAAE